MIRQPIIATKIGETLVRYRVTYLSDVCFRGTQTARYLQYEMLKTLAADPTVGMCGTTDFQTMSMSHDGERWVVTLEAETEESKK